jgi:DnaJ-class molecular chaperone
MQSVTDRQDQTTGLPCPHCHGKGSNPGFICFADGEATRSRFDKAIQCSLCKGAGSISREVAAWRMIGKRHRDARVAREESILECSRKMGIRPSELSAMENGRANPATLEAHDAR